MLLRLHAEYNYVEERFSGFVRSHNPKKFFKPSAETSVAVIEEFTFRNSNYMSIILVLYTKNEEVFLDVTTSGAGSGILNFNFGANKSREKRVLNFLENHNISYDVVQ